jgi:arsenate reductase
LLRKRGLKASALSEENMRDLLLEHYSFLKRPVLIYQDELFIGNAPATIAAAEKVLHE